jgi:hypothetical protein
MINYHVTAAMAEQHRSELRRRAEQRRLAKRAEPQTGRPAAKTGPAWAPLRWLSWLRVSLRPSELENDLAQSVSPFQVPVGVANRGQRVRPGDRELQAALHDQCGELGHNCCA